MSVCLAPPRPPLRLLGSGARPSRPRNYQVGILYITSIDDEWSAHSVTRAIDGRARGHLVRHDRSFEGGQGTSSLQHHHACRHYRQDDRTTMQKSRAHFDNHSLAPSLTYLPHSLPHSLTHSTPHSRASPLPHSLTHPPTTSSAHHVPSGTPYNPRCGA